MRAVSAILLAALMHLLAGCSLLSFSDNEVVERSKESRPEWLEIESEPNKMQIDEQAYVFVVSKDQILNFPVGAKEAQVEGMATSQVLFTDVTVERLNETAQSHGLKISSVDGMRQISQTVVGEIHALYAAVGDLYYEKRLDKSKEPSAQLYHIYVKITVPKTVGPMLDQRLAAEFAKSPYDDLRSLAKLLTLPQALPAAGVSH